MTEVCRVGERGMDGQRRWKAERTVFEAISGIVEPEYQIETSGFDLVFGFYDATDGFNGTVAA